MFVVKMLQYSALYTYIYIFSHMSLCIFLLVTGKAIQPPGTFIFCNCHDDDDDYNHPTKTAPAVPAAAAAGCTKYQAATKF